MEAACKDTGYRNPQYLDTLAAAYAEAGRFQDAVATAEKALGLAAPQWPAASTRQLQWKLALYRQGKRFRLPAAN